MARKLRGFERVLDAPSIFAVAYSEIGASIYFALGIVAAQALGLTPVVLLLTGLLFVVVALSYAEGTTAIPETGGAATLVRRAFNDPLGFGTGWVLFLDYLIVIALAALFFPHYVAGAVGLEGLRESPWDVVVAAVVIGVIAAVRLVRRTRIHLGAIGVALLDLLVQLLIVILGLAFLFSPETLVDGLSLADGQGWDDVAFAIPLAMLAYTGLETVANLAEEAREPGQALPRSLFSGIGLVVVMTVLIATIGMSAYPASGGETALGEEWLEAPMVGIVAALDGPLPGGLVDVLQIVVGISGALILLAAVTTSMSGCARLAHSMGEHGMLPREFGRLERRTLVSRETIVAIATIAIAAVIVTGVLADDDPAFLAGLYSFGVLLAFTAAQLAVIRLRRREPDLVRPFRARPDVRLRGVDVPLPALVGAPLTLAIWILAMITHESARWAGIGWLAIGVVVYGAVRWWNERGMLEHVDPLVLPPGATFRRVLVPMKLGDIGEEMVATAIAIAMERDAEVEALFVVKVPREFPLDGGALPAHVEQRMRDSLDEARALGEDNGVDVKVDMVRARSIGHAIVEEATRRDSDLIVLGSSPRWRRQSRFFSPTVDYVLRRAPCEVLVVAFPQSALEAVGSE